ncbi:MAG: RluA family pseudouridine synthase [Ruminococcaceae bacterium]|nr:RluA family pseudouridine synthase [Oscillospiraceae bacterium]
MRKIEFTACPNDSGIRIKDYLRAFGVSSSLLTRLKQTENGITLNGSFARTIDTLSDGDKLVIEIENRGHMPSPVKMDIEVCYEDEDIIVLNKPPLMPVHESRNHIGDTLSNFVAYHLNEDTAFRAVYRLDRDTSGLVVVAKHELAASKLAGNIVKHYYALVQGSIAESGTVDLPVARCGDSIIKRRVSENGERAVTHYEPVTGYDGYTLVKFTLETGRTHQIRVHMSHIGHPLLGDSLYGGDCTMINRQALHCRDIRLTHPVTLKTVHIECEFPKDIKNLI